MRKPRKRRHSEEAKARARLRRQDLARERAKVTQPEPTGNSSKAKRGYQPATLYRISELVRKSGVLASVVDSRVPRLVKFSAQTLIAVLMFGLLTAQTSMRGIETLTTQLSSPVRKSIGLAQQRVSDTALHDFLKLLRPGDIGQVLVRFAKAMWSMGKLKPQGLPFSVAAFDGKNTLTLKFKAAFRALNKARLEQDLSVVPDVFFEQPHANKKQLKGFFAESLPMVQLVFPTRRVKGKRVAPHGLIRSHRMTLVSSMAAITLFNEFIPGWTNEVGHAPGFLKRALAAYQRTGIAKMVTADAGNCSEEIAHIIREMGSHYMLAIKKNQPDALFEAHRLLGTKHSELRKPDHVIEDWVDSGKDNKQLRQQREVWLADVTGLISKFSSAVQLFRIRRTVHETDGTVEVGNRYFITSMPPSELKPKQAATVIRMYWGCENGGHWPSDLIWHEDTPRSPLTRMPQMLEVMTTLRLLAQSMVAVLRAMTKRGYDESTPISWKEVIENIKRVFWGAVRVRSTVEVLVGD